MAYAAYAITSFALHGIAMTTILFRDIITWYDDIALLISTPFDQPRSQGLSSLPPLVVGIETLVAAGHVTTQNLGGKKICWVGGVAEYFDCCCGKLCWFQNFEQSLKTTRVIGVWCGSLPLKNATLFLPSPRYTRLSFTKKLGSRMELKRFNG